MSVKELFKPEFRDVQGGLFAKVVKADVGDGAVKLLEQGVTLLCWADPYFPSPSTPEHVKQAALNAINAGSDVHYTMPIGSASLKELIGKKLRKKGYAHIEPQRNILITPGSDPGLFYAMFPFISPGDEILIPDPSYPNNFQNTSLMGGTIVRVPLSEENGYYLDAAEIEKLITDKTKMFVLTNPNNPTTTVFSKKEIEDLCKIIVKHNLILVVDQAFEDIVFDGREMTEAALLPGMWERTVLVCSTSKGMGLSGYRVAYIVACDEIMDRLYGAAVTVIGATNTLAQIAAHAAFENDSFIQKNAECFDRRRKYLFEKFTAVKGVKMLMPQSAFLAWVDVSGVGDSTDIVSYLVQEAKCLVNDGKGYGKAGEGYLRICFGCVKDDNELFAAVDRMAAALAKYKK